MPTPIFMFHAIGDIDVDDWADKHYSFSEDKFYSFIHHFDRVISLKEAITLGNVNDLPVVGFDDGHISNYQAAKVLHAHNGSTADFFINPEFVGQPYYMSWDQLRELHEMGMSIQSHGLNHQYLSDCSDSELRKQLQESKRLLEHKLPLNVTILAPPGGRFDRRTVSIAKELGYQTIANSIPGRVNLFSQFLLPRIPVMYNNSVALLIDCCKGSFNMHVSKLIIKYRLTKLLKVVMGNRRYEQFRLKMLGDA